MAHHHRVFPGNVDAAAKLLQRSGAYQAVDNLIFGDCTRFEAQQRLAVHYHVERWHLREHLHILKVLHRLILRCKALEIDGVAVGPFIELAHRHTAGCREQRHAHIVAAEPGHAGSSLVVIHFQHRHFRLPVGCNQGHIGALLHDSASRVGKLVEHSRVGTAEHRLNGIFLEHQVIFLQLHVGIGIVRFHILLNLADMLIERAGRGEVDNQLSVGKRRIGNAAHQIVSPRCAANRGGHVGHIFVGAHQVGADAVEVGSHAGGIGAFGQLIFHIELVVGHIGEEAVLHKFICHPREREQRHYHTHHRDAVAQTEAQHVFEAMVERRVEDVFISFATGGCLFAILREFQIAVAHERHMHESKHPAEQQRHGKHYE